MRNDVINRTCRRVQIDGKVNPNHELAGVQTANYL